MAENDRRPQEGSARSTHEILGIETKRAQPGARLIWIARTGLLTRAFKDRNEEVQDDPDVTELNVVQEVGRAPLTISADTPGERLTEDISNFVSARHQFWVAMAHAIAESEGRAVNAPDPVEKTSDR